MRIGSVFFFVAIFGFDKLIKALWPEKYEKIILPCNIIATVLIVAYCVYAAYGIYEVLASDVAADSKILFVAFMGALVLLYLFILIKMWRDWRREREE